MQTFAKRFYKSKAWLACRRAYFISVHGFCEQCGAGGKIVHHKITLTPANINNPSITLNFNNLRLLCQDCHNKIHGGAGATVDGLTFDENGNIFLAPPR